MCPATGSRIRNSAAVANTIVQPGSTAAARAIGDPPGALGALERASDPKAALLLLRDGFDMLSEAFAEERFYARLRALYWQAAAGSPARTRIQRVMTALDF